MTQTEALKLALEALIGARAFLESDAPVEIWSVNDKAITAIKAALAQDEFIKHEAENSDDWSEWVCPNPSGYLMKCCDCGLVHEAEFGVVRYKSETEREDCDMVDDPNLQAVFRMRRSEEWLPEDTAHRAGGLPMAQPAQEPVGRFAKFTDGIWREVTDGSAGQPLYTTPPQRKPLTRGQIREIEVDVSLNPSFDYITPAEQLCRAIEAAHGIKE